MPTIYVRAETVVQVVVKMNGAMVALSLTSIDRPVTCSSRLDKEIVHRQTQAVGLISILLRSYYTSSLQLKSVSWKHGYVIVVLKSFWLHCYRCLVLGAMQIWVAIMPCWHWPLRPCVHESPRFIVQLRVMWCAGRCVGFLILLTSMFCSSLGALWSWQPHGHIWPVVKSDTSA